MSSQSAVISSEFYSASWLTQVELYWDVFHIFYTCAGCPPSFIANFYNPDDDVIGELQHSVAVGPIQHLGSFHILSHISHLTWTGFRILSVEPFSGHVDDYLELTFMM